VVVGAHLGDDGDLVVVSLLDLGDLAADLFDVFHVYVLGLENVHKLDQDVVLVLDAQVLVVVVLANEVVDVNDFELLLLALLHQRTDVLDVRFTFQVGAEQFLDQSVMQVDVLLFRVSRIRFY